MSKAEDFAIKKYPISMEDVYGHKVDVNLWQRKAYVDGYHQAEKDLELTWEDINNIKLIIEQVECDYVEQDKKLYTKYFYEEVLKRFKKLKK